MAAAGIRYRRTSPNHELSSPGAKPIERVFGTGGIQEEICNDLRVRDLGRKGKEVPAALLLEVIAGAIASVNARIGRRGRGMNGRSFDQVFAEKFNPTKTTNVSHLTRNLFALNSEIVSVQRDGLITIKAGRGQEKNKYWSPDSREYRYRQIRGKA